MTKFDNIDPQIQKYVNDVLSGEEIAGEAIRLACKRYKDWFNKYYFDIEKYNKVVDFIGHLKHFEDVWAGYSFDLLPWQRWVISNIFCWYQKDDHTKRVVRNVFLLISRNN